MSIYQEQIEEIWENYVNSTKDQSQFQEAATLVNEVVDLINSGRERVCQKIHDDWVVNEWLKKAILLSFKFSNNEVYSAGPLQWFDKIRLKFSDDYAWGGSQIRVVPGAIVRYGAYVGRNVILMPSFVNIGVYIGDGTMIDSCVTVGSCAQIGRNCHISSNVSIGGVLEPLQASPVIIEDDCFIGGGSVIVEGVTIGEGSVIGMGTNIGASTKIIDRKSGEIIYGKVPPYSVVVPGSLPGKPGEPSLACAVIVKQVTKATRSKTSINELLRDN